MKIPNYAEIKVIDEKGFFTPEWKIIIQQLLSQLQQNASNEGLVAPTQNAADITIIENNQVQNQGSSPATIYTCQFGTILYDSTNNSGRFAIDDGTGKPTFKTIVLI